MISYPDEVLMVFSNCIPVQGFNRSIIYDLTRNKYTVISNKLYFFLKENQAKRRSIIFNEAHQNILEIREYINLLESHDYVFWADEAISQNFKALDLEWKRPEKVSNAVIEIVKIDLDYLVSVAKDLAGLGCRCVDIHFYMNDYLPEELETVIKVFSDESFSQTDMCFFNDFNSANFDFVVQLCNSYLSIHSIVVYNSQLSQKDYVEIKNCSVVIINEKYREDKGKTARNFSVNMNSFTEAQKYNLYYNRKLIFTSKQSELNNPAKIVYSDIGSIEEKLRDKRFNEINVSKDQITICNDCEFRYMCVDSRIPKLNARGQYYFETECNYNPYISKWSHEKDYMTLKECGICYEINKM
jgi:SPASM domain peptide maturase of grasp-with-spasm system